MYKVRKII